jgi:hypothetical protein
MNSVKTPMTDAELLAATNAALLALTGGHYEVRVIDNVRVALLVLYIRDEPVAVVKLNDEQAHHLSVLLVQAAERIARFGYHE